MEPDMPRGAPKRPSEAQKARKAQNRSSFKNKYVRSPHGAKQAQESPKKASRGPEGQEGPNRSFFK